MSRRIRDEPGGGAPRHNYAAWPGVADGECRTGVEVPGDEAKNAVAELLLMPSTTTSSARPNLRVLRRSLVLDEAWRPVQSPFLEPLSEREGRAFGLGVVIATQS